jgi:gamma-glutamylcyclotransferase (GGCT)/AIG2-like uncharacterized protein YtfP
MARRPYDSELSAAVDAVNVLRRSLPPGATSLALIAAEARLERQVPCSRRLAVYGTLVPGGDNHDLLVALGGHWFRGWVRGVRFTGRRGSAAGYPALALDPDGDRVPVAVLESPSLPRRFGPIDLFEGNDYRRVVTPVWDDGGLLAIANVYEAVEDPPARSTAT